MLALLTLALALSLLRVGLGEADRWRGDLERALSARLGVAVTVGSVSGRLAGLVPVITLDAARIGPEDARAEIEQVRVTLDPWRSLFGGALQVSELTLAGVRVEATGRPDLPEVPLVPAMSVPERIRVVDARVAWRSASGADALSVRDIALRVDRVGDGLSLRMTGESPFAEGSDLALAAEAALDPWRGGHAYLRTKHLDFVRLRPLLDAFLPDAALQPVGEGGIELWVDWRDGRPTGATGRFDLSDPGHDGTVALSNASGAIAWYPRPTGWEARLQLDEVSFLGAESPTRVRAALDREGDRWRLGLERIRVPALLGLASGRVPAEPFSRLAEAGPVGVVHDLGLSWTSHEHWRGRGRLSGFGLAPVITDEWRTPGVSGVDLTLDVGPEGGSFGLDGTDGAIELPWLFRDPLPFTAVAGVGSWSRQEGADGRWHFRAPHLRGRGNDGDISASLDVWAGGGRTPFLDVRATLTDGRAGETSRYLPAPLMPQALVEWLDAAIVDGRVAQADLTLFGPAAAFPFRGREGVFEVRADVRDTRFAYQPGWPALDDVAGELHFRDAAMTITAREGRLYGAALDEAIAHIPDLAAPELGVNAVFRGPGRDMLAFLVDAPITADDTRLLSRLRLDGDHALQLGLGIPFDGRAVSVDGRLRLEGGTLTLADLPYRVEDIMGTVRFDRHGLAWDGLEGRFNGQPLLSRAVTRGDGEQTRIVSNTRFRAPVDALLPDLPGLARLRGGTSWLLTVDAAGFGAASADYEIMLDSDLQGVDIDAPAPFGKRADRARRLAVRGMLGATASPPWTAQYGDVLSAILELAPEGGEPRRLGLRLGGGDARLPEVPGTRLEGVLERLPATGDVGADGPAGLVPELRELDFTMPPIRAAGFRLPPLRVRGTRGADGWVLDLAGSATGQLTWRGGLQPEAVRLDVEKLMLERDPQPESRDVSADGGWRRELPALEGRIERVSLDDKALGALEVSAEREGRSLVLRQLQLEGDGYRIDAEGGWDADSDESHVELRADIADAGRLLEGLAEETPLSGGEGTVTFSGNWPGSLLSPRVSRLRGDLRIDLRDGSLIAVEPGPGRLVGLFSLALVPRRLGLDFSDVTDAGFAFDEFSAAFSLRDGVAHTQSFIVDGPAARVEVQGPIDLVERRYDQTVTVVPRVSSTLPILGGLAGGPQVALVLLVANQLFGDGVDELSRFGYRVEGGWDAPTLTPVMPETPDASEGGR